jgi:hypothetical protein
MMLRQEPSEVRGPTPQDPVVEDPSPVVTMTREELRELVDSLLAKQLQALGLEDPTAEVTTPPVAPAPVPDRPPHPGEPEPERPVASDQGASGLVPVYVLKPLRENERDYLPGQLFPTLPARAQRLTDLGLCTLNAAQAPPVPAPVPSIPEASALSMASVPRGMIWRRQ